MPDFTTSPATIFVGRETFLETFRERLNARRIEGDAAMLLLYGAAGWGKSTLCRHWTGELKQGAVPHAMIDLGLSSGVAHLVLELRLKLGETSRLKFARFDRAYRCFHRLTTGLSWEPNTSSSLPSLLIEAAKLAFPTVPIDALRAGGNYVKELPFVESIVGQLLPKGEATRQFEEACRSNDAPRIQSWLSWALAQDLEDALKEKGAARPVLIFDTFERCSSQMRKWLQQFCGECPSVLKMCSGQNSLTEQDWEGCAVELLPELKGLGPDESQEYLARRGVESPDLRRHLSQISDGYPLRLQLCADTCDALLRREGRPARPSDFHAALLSQNIDVELREHLCRDLSGEVRDALRLCTIPQWFDFALLGAFVPLRSVWRLYPELERLSGLCAPDPNRSGVLKVRDETRQAFRDEARADPSWDEWVHALLRRCLLLSRQALREDRREQALNYVVVGLQVGREEEANAQPDEGILTAMVALHQGAASILNGLGRFDEAADHARRMCVVAEACGDEAGWCKGALMRGCIESRLNHEFGDFDLLDQAIALLGRAADDSDDEAVHLALVEAEFSRAGAAFRLQRLDVARTALANAGQRLTNLPAPRFGARNRGRLSALVTQAQMQGELEAHQGLWAEAEAHLRRALSFCAELPEERSRQARECAAKGWLGIVGLRLGRPDALDQVQAALRDERDVLRSAEGITKWLHLLGEVYADASFAGHDRRKALHALWLSAQRSEALQHVEGNKTQRLLLSMERVIDPQQWRETRREYEAEGGIWREWRDEPI